MSTTSYASILVKENDLKNKLSYRRQAKQATQGMNTTRCQKDSIQPVSPHSEDCPMGEAAKDILIGKLLEDRAKEISIVAQEIYDIQEEWQRELQNSRVRDDEQLKQLAPNLIEIEDRERELKIIQDDIINILKNRNKERILKKLKKKDNNRTMKDEYVLDYPKRWSENNKDDQDSECDDNYPLFQEDEDGTDDVENEINFIENLIEEDILGESTNHAFHRLSGSMEDNEDMNLDSNFQQQKIEHELKTEYFEMKRLLKDIENEFE